MREIRGIKFNSDTFTTENSLAALQLSEPDKLTRKLTYLWGMDSDKFPLSTMTEGQGLAGIKPINDVQYTWEVMGRMRHTEELVSFDSTAFPQPGVNHTPFYVVFKSEWFIAQWGLIAPDGVTHCRIMEPPTRVGNGFRYTLQLKTTDATAYVDLANLRQGKFWVLSAPTVPESMSKGNRSNKMGPGKLTNQISFTRYTKHIGGNLANKVSNIEFETENGGTTNLWINEEMRQFEIDIRQMEEEHLWLSEYNRDINGNIAMKDYDSGQPIPEGAGVMEMVKSINYDTYGYYLPLSKIDNTITDIFTSDTDTGTMEIVLYAGKGFFRDFDNCIKTEANSNSQFTPLGNLMMGEKDGYLTYGKYFNSYKTIDGHIVTIRPLRLLDFGTIAEMQKKNGNVHPRTGLPMISHTGIFLDHSLYNSERNVVMAEMTGQANITGIYKGLAPIPPSWGVIAGNAISTDEDRSSYEKKYSKGINILNLEHCFMLQSTF